MRKLQSKRNAMQDKSNAMPCIEISVGGNALPLKIGDKIDAGSNVTRVVMKVQVNEDGRAVYGLQWFDGADFKLDWMTWDEICYMDDLIKNKPKGKYLEG